MKYLAVALMAVLAVATSVLAGPEEAVFDPDTATSAPPLSICPIVEAAGRTTSIAVLSSVNGAGRLSTFAAGSELGSLDFRTGGSGSVVLPASEAGAVGFSGALVEMPSESTASGVIVTGSGSLSSETCADIPTGQASISGGSTAGDDAFELLLLNPYAGEAIVDLTVSSDSGVESDDRFNSVIVPALSTRTIDMTSIIPERERVTVSMETIRGSVLGVGRQTTAGETALWRAVEPAQDWWLPVPGGDVPRQLLISSASASETQYQIDLYTTEGFVEGFDSGVVTPRGQATVSLSEISAQPLGVRVIATSPTVATLWMSTETGVAATTGSQVDAPVWLLPGASLPTGGSGSIVVLNSGIESADVGVRSLKDDSLIRNFSVPAEGVLVVDIIAADGYRLEATGPVVAMWLAQSEGAVSAAIGMPIQDG